VIAPGAYRDRIQLPMNGQETDAPIIIEAKEKGTVIVSGSNIWDGWQRRKNSAIYTHAWPYKWGLALYPPGWEGIVVLADIVRRREMIFVNGRRHLRYLPHGITCGGEGVDDDQVSENRHSPNHNPIMVTCVRGQYPAQQRSHN
jgi:hypothetical protein